MSSDRSVADAAVERFRRVDSLFDEVLDLPPEQQAAHIDRSCAGDAQLRTELRALLRAYYESEGFLESAAAAIVAPLLADTGASSPVPAKVGVFRVVREIGRGGMGTVYLGERADGEFEQRVALKLIRHAAPGAVRRFMTERRILARLEHPGIARLIDGGIADGRPYFAMELVEGEPIDRWCAARDLPLADRLDLFARVCDAVAWAHHHLVIHRDLKPTNILVTADGQVKLLDFGIATLLGDVAREETGTELRALTPEFAAPEQVLGRPVTTAADIYSLGVLLYVLTSGERPYDVRGRTPAEIERIVCGDDPPLPSERAPQSVRARVRGDLDAIVLKAMQKDPTQRYPSVEGLLEDIERHRSGHPVHARRSTALYRARRFAGRHRWSLTVAAAMVVLVGGYIASMVLQQRRITHALAEARTGAERAEQVTELMLALFEASDRGGAFGDTVTARALLHRGSIMARELTGRPEVQAQMLDALGRLHMQLGANGEARASFEEALAARARTLDADHVDLATSHANLAASLEALGEADSAIALYRRALAVRRRRLGDGDPATLHTLYSLAAALHGAGEREEATRLFDEWRVAVTAQPALASPQRAQQYVLLGQLLTYRGDHDAAIELLTRAVRMRTELYGPTHRLVARSIGALAGAYLQAGRFAEAERLERESLDVLRRLHPDESPDVVRTMRNVAVTLHRQRQWAAAESLYVEARALAARTLGPTDGMYATLSEDLGLVLLAGGDPRRAEPYAREAHDLYLRENGRESLLTRRAGVLLGNALLQLGDTAAAEPLLLDGYRALSAGNVPGFSFATRTAAEGLARISEARGRHEDAQRYREVAQRYAR